MLCRVSSESDLSDHIVFRTCPIRLITQSSSYVFQNSSIPSASLTIEPTKCIWLPERDEMKVLVDKYITDMTHMHHIVHDPSLRALVDETYDSLQQSPKPVVGRILLLLAICGYVTFAWTARDCTRCLFANDAEAHSQSMFWVKAALDTMGYCQRNVHTSIESIQGHVILSFVVCNLEGLNLRSQALISTAIIMARELGLHRLDYRHNATSGQTSRLSGLEAEVGRRIWWYLVGTDWMLARFCGPREGTYTINPQHMVVRKPYNMNDEDLIDGAEPVDRPMEEPTCMSYHLQRVRLAEISRGFTDRNPLAASDPEAVGYDHVLELDAAIDRYMKELPPFFLLGHAALDALPPSDPRRSPGIGIQRYVLNLFVHGQRCKLHLPYLARGTVDPAYTYSRNICLESARFIIKTEHRLQQENVAFAATRLRLTIVLHSVFLASIVLLLDVCLGVETESKDVRRQEMLDAWAILEDAKTQSVAAVRLMEMLKQVMRKHKVPLPPAARYMSSQVAAKAASGEADLPITPGSSTGREVSNDMMPAENISLGQEWNSLDARMEIDEIDWDSLLWGLDAPFI
ncbi:hypothetical protein G7046_g9600 [Stylonectria norvegica]|nr:hypothetical protein G7046_g9600 [Stylonectria norvegica]